MKEHIQMKHLKWIVSYAIKKSDGTIIEYDGLTDLETGEKHEPLTVDSFSISSALSMATRYLRDKLPDDGSEFMIYDIGVLADSNLFT